jgi:hypothetical protein
MHDPHLSRRPRIIDMKLKHLQVIGTPLPRNCQTTPVDVTAITRTPHFFERAQYLVS